MVHVDLTEDATPTEAAREQPYEFSARFENGVVTHFEGKSGRPPVSNASPQAHHVKLDAIASETRRGQVRRYDNAVEQGTEPKSHRDETAPISRILEAGEFGAGFKSQTQRRVARIFQVRGKAQVPR